MNQTKELINAILEPLGMSVRTFVAEYRDDNNNYYHKVTGSIVIGDDIEVAASLANEIEVKGFTVYCIYEVLNGYDLKEINRMARRDPQAASKHIKLLYRDMSKERVKRKGVYH